MKVPQGEVGLIVLMVLLFVVPQGRRATYDPGNEITIAGEPDV